MTLGLGTGLGLSGGGSVVPPLSIAGAATAWTTPKAIQLTPEIIAFGYTKDDGHLYVSEVDADTGRILNTVRLGDQYTKDDHNSIALELASDGALVACITGHHNPLAGGSNAKYQVYRSPSGRISGFGDEYVITTTINLSNYQQLLKSGSKIWLWTNDDGDVSWRFLRSGDDGQTWTNGQRVFRQAGAPGGGSNQVYSYATIAGEDRIRFVLVAHPTNLENAIHYGEIDMISGAVYSGEGGAANGANAITNYGTIKTTADYGVIYTPPEGKSVRLQSFSPAGDAMCICEFDNTDGAHATHYVLYWDSETDIYTAEAWQKVEIGAAGTSYDDNPDGTYFADMQFSLETGLEGVRLFRAYNNGLGNYCSSSEHSAQLAA